MTPDNKDEWWFRLMDKINEVYIEALKHRHQYPYADELYTQMPSLVVGGVIQPWSPGFTGELHGSIIRHVMLWRKLSPSDLNEMAKSELLELYEKRLITESDLGLLNRIIQSHITSHDIQGAYQEILDKKDATFLAKCFASIAKDSLLQALSTGKTEVFVTGVAAGDVAGAIGGASLGAKFGGWIGALIGGAIGGAAMSIAIAIDSED